MNKNCKENNMFYIDYVTKEKATGIMKELYDKLEPLGLLVQCWSKALYLNSLSRI